MLIADIIRVKGNVVRATSTHTLVDDAIRLLVTHRIGALVVSNDERHIDGILSERDIVRALSTQYATFHQQTVGDLMTPDVFTCGPDSTVIDVMELMTKKRIRHVPVTVKGVLTAVVSIGDIVNARLQETEAEAREMADYIAGAS